MVTTKQNGILLGRALVAAKKKLGGVRNVFVPLDGIFNGTVYVPFGGKLMNPFPGVAKAYAGDLFYYKTDEKAENPELYLLKTYEVTSASGTTVNIVRDGFHHIPFVGDTLMVAPEEIGGAGNDFTVVAVAKTTDNGKDVWALTLSSAPSTAPKEGDILVESDGEGNMLVKDVNTLTPNDLDFVFEPVADPSDMEDYDDARYHIPVVLGGIMYTHKMSPMPKCVLDLNTSKVNGWFVMGAWGNF